MSKIEFNMEIKSSLKNYLDYLEIEKNRSPKTRENYERYLSAFLEFSKINTPGEITAELVREFRIHLARVKTDKGEEIKKSTQSYYVIALRNFLKYLAKNNIKSLPPEKIELPKVPSRQIEIIGFAELERLLKAPSGNDLRSFRDRAILETLFSTGLRISELCSLDRYLDFSRGELSVRGKGGKLRVVFISATAKEAIKNYLDKRGDAEPALFISLSKKQQVIGRIIPRAIQRLVNFYTRKAGIAGKVTPHQLRHQFATDLLMNGADLRAVQEMLGHANISTTQVYTHVTNKSLREIHQAFHDKRREGDE